MRSTSIYCCSNKPVLHRLVEPGQFGAKVVQRTLSRHAFRCESPQIGDLCLRVGGRVHHEIGVWSVADGDFVARTVHVWLATPIYM